MSHFTHLHTHSHYSLLNALPKIDELVKKAKKCGMTALALTDNCNLYGAIEFYKECEKAEIKPIIGIDAYVAYRSRRDKQTGVDKDRYRLVLLAENQIGYKNLIHLVTEAHLDGFYYKPRVDREILEKYHEGIIAISPSFSGDVVKSLSVSDTERAEEKINWYKEVFGPENFFLEITKHPEIKGHEEKMRRLVEFARKTDTKICASHDVYYLEPEDRAARETLMAVQNNADISEKILSSEEDDFSFISGEQAEKLFADLPDALENNQKIADRCDLALVLGKWVFPDYKVENGLSHDDELRRVTYEGIESHGLARTPELLARVDYELEVIKNKGYSPYFLVVGDLLRYAKSAGILTTTRGSAGGSMVSYLNYITTINPIEYELPFERFLNPERPSAPDVDMDMADTRRDDMIDYAKHKYGNGKVAQIGTFGTMAARGSVRDVTRALGFPYSLGDSIAKMIPIGAQGFPMTIDRALSDVPELNERYKTEKDVASIIDMAKKIEGCARHMGIHAAGVVIAPTEITDFTALQYDPKGDGKIITQYDMYSIEEAGLLKFDFLGIVNLTILADAIKLVKKLRGLEIDIENIPVDDKKTFEMLSRGETQGLFQLNGAGMTRWLTELKPTVIYDLNVMVALYRPGPMDNINNYIARKHGREKITYLHPKMKNFLDKTFGVLVYQDDLLMTAIELAGYSWGEVDKFRKAVGKKIPEEMKKQHVRFVEGCVTHSGMTTEKAEAVWKLFEPFQGYGFNKCLSGDTLIVDNKTGLRYSIRDIFENKNKVFVNSLSLNGRDKFKLVSKKTSTIVKNGVKDIFELTTRTGKKIKATSNHPFYVFDGWKNLADCKVGDKIATPRIIEIFGKKGVGQNKAATLGYLLSEGNLCHPHGAYFYSTQEDEISDFISAVSEFPNINCTLNRSKAAVSVYCGQTKKCKGNSLMKWLEKMNLLNKTAISKFIPDEVFGWKHEDQVVFLAKLWQGDGCVSIKNFQTYYATSSARLAKDVQHLLLRFGINSTIYKKSFKYRDGIKIGYTVVITHKENILSFFDAIDPYLIGKKKEEIKKLSKIIGPSASDKVEARGTKDVIPAEILIIIKKEMFRRGVTINELSKKSGLSKRLFSVDIRKKGFTRKTIGKIAKFLNSEILKQYANSDVYWDEIISITSAGKEMTYDLSVPPHANFVANDIIIHNSHAASYGRVAYQTAYMKCNFPAEYMCSVLTHQRGEVEDVAVMVEECKRMGIPVLPPDINESFEDFTVVKSAASSEQRVARENEDANTKDKIRFGLTTIKNFGEGIGQSIISERKSGGHFKSISDFLSRVKDKNLNKKSLESLIKAGAFDSLADRFDLLHNLDRLLQFSKEERGKESDQSSLFSIMSEVHKTEELSLDPAPENERNSADKLLWEKELLGLYISGHPLDSFRDKLLGREINIKKLKEKSREKEPVVLAGIVEEIKPIMTKKGDKMVFLKISDLSDSIECVVFPKVYEEFQDMLASESCIVIKGTISKRNDEKSIVIEKVKMLE